MRHARRLPLLLIAATALGGIALMAVTALAAPGALVVEIDIHFSHFTPEQVHVPAGRPVTFVLRNEDPIDHEWIVGDAAVHERHRTGTEPSHGARPTEQSIPALSEVRTTITFDAPGPEQYICHLPGHEAYGMVGTVIVDPPPG
jgi:uncharacterized cupredoxin-like copper-binding protein